MSNPLLNDPNRILPALVTPLTAEGQLDTASAERLIDHLYQQGVGGLYVLGSTGEGVALDFEIRRRLAELCVHMSRSRGKVIVPSFAIGRVEELLYWLQRLEREARIPSMPTYVDSPMAAEAMQFYASRPDELDPEMRPLHRGPMFDTRRLHVIKDTEESKALTRSSGPAIPSAVLLDDQGIFTVSRSPVTSNLP